MNQYEKRIIAAVVVGIAIVSAIYIPLRKDAVVHTAYATLVLAVILSGASLWQLQKKLAQDVITNLAFPLALRAYLALTVLMAIVFVWLDLASVWSISFSWYAALQVVLIGLTAWKLLAIGAAQDAILQTGAQVQATMSNWKLLQADADAILKAAPATLQRDVSDVRDAIRDADPMSRPEVAIQEQEIAGGLGQLRELVKKNKADEAKALCTRIKDVVANRANRLKILK